ncbi:hypothetical protein [Nocardia sp. NPDC060259]|uniref:hypothetical protein n=1 Tax=Nocardia sp. NPDC060259 TaxID=3347088 RepID=UPI00365DAF39
MTVRELQRRERVRSRPWSAWVASSAVISGFSVVLILVIEAVSPDFVAWLYGVPVVLGAGISWICLAAGFDASKPGGRSLLAIQPVMVVCGVVAAMMHLPERIAWLVSESRITSVAQRCDRLAEPRWVGVFRVEEIRRDRNGTCEFRIGDRLGVDGLAYFPPGVQVPPVGESSTRYTPFDGQWYRYEFVADYID